MADYQDLSFRKWRRWPQSALDAVMCAAASSEFALILVWLMIIAVQEWGKARRGFKPLRNAMADCCRRSMCAVCAVLAGCAAAERSGLLSGTAVAAAVRVLLDCVKPQILTGWRVYQRILRLQALSMQLRMIHQEQKESRDSHAYSFTDGEKSAIMKRDSS